MLVLPRETSRALNLNEALKNVHFGSFAGPVSDSLSIRSEQASSPATVATSDGIEDLIDPADIDAIFALDKTESGEPLVEATPSSTKKWLADTENHAKDGNHRAPNPNKPKGYQWMSKSSKRRARKRIQMQKQEEMKSSAGKGKGVAIPETWWTLQLLQRGLLLRKQGKLVMSQRLTQWRRRKMERKTDPFSKCYGDLHHFICGHLVRVLCWDCSLSWDVGRTEPCHLYIEALELKNKDLGSRGKFGSNLHFERACPECLAAGNEVTESFKKPWSGNYPHWVWRVLKYDPVYILKDSMRRQRKTEFYVIS